MMVTIYDLLEVSEDATKDEIERAYQKMLITYKADPRLSDKENKDNAFILEKLKMAYDILINDEKRKKYDNNLANKRAEDLIKNVSVKDEVQSYEPNKEEVEKETEYDVNPIKPFQEKSAQELKNERYDQEFDDTIDNENNNVELTSDEKARLRKAAKEEFEKNLAKVQQAEEEYNKAYDKAYKEYVKTKNKEGFKAKLKKIGITLIVILIVIIMCAIAWHIPAVKNALIELYYNNVIFKIIADIFLTIFNMITGIFKK